MDSHDLEAEKIVSFLMRVREIACPPELRFYPTGELPQVCGVGLWCGISSVQSIPSTHLSAGDGRKYSRDNKGGSDLGVAPFSDALNHMTMARCTS
jgi:hypothetical protein